MVIIMITVKPPYLGTAYYPEDWDKSEITHDIEMMKKAGFEAKAFEFLTDVFLFTAFKKY